MIPALFHASVEHERFHPARHRLAYRIRVYAFDLDDLARLDRRLPLFGYNRRRPVSVADRDYLTPGPAPIREKFLARFADRVAPEAVARIVLVTTPRHFGYVFNPVSFYYAFDAAGRLLGCLAEVNNTFGERHLYVLSPPDGPTNVFPARFEADKQFHVSPFNDRRGRYHFTLGDIRRELDIGIRLYRDDRLVLEARLRGRPSPLTAAGHLGALVRHPLRPHLTIPRIYWQAFRLRFERGLAYHAKPVPTHPLTVRRNPAGPVQRRCLALVRAQLEQSDRCGLRLLLPDGRTLAFGPDAAGGPTLQVHDWRFFSRVVFGSDIGFGESYMHGEWDAEDPVAVVRFFIRNRPTLDDGQFRAGLARRGVELLRTVSRANTLIGSRRNIRRHYDLSNDFFALFLDREMVYSCALFAPGDVLETAQQRKFERIMDKAHLGPEDHVLEIGCGWGSFAMAAARRVGCRVTGITVSPAQYRLARRRVAAAGLDHLVTIRLADYRRVGGRYDKIVSIEMLEAVGHAWFATFFARLDRLLAPGGIAVVQTITIPDAHYDRYRRQPDWIRKHIFPGGLLPSLTVLTRAMTRRSRLMVEHAENIGDHYAPTLAEWRRRFEARREEAARLGFDETFQRKWIYYLASCEAGFRERVLGDLQLVLTREANPALAALPPDFRARVK